MKRFTKSGIPTVGQYEKLLKSSEFSAIEDFSNAFIQETSGLLGAYNKKWVKDPFHQWSRQWEYPYVIDVIKSYIEIDNTYEALDLGSGITFLPFYINKLSNNTVKVVCSDYDASLKTQFENVNCKLDGVSTFSLADLRKLPYKDSSFDIIYSVSVLEHTNDYAAAVSEVQRVLKPGGIFILTFDISIDNKDDISVESALELIDILSQNFPKNKLPNKEDFFSNVEQKDILKSNSVAKLDKSLMPWKYPIINVIKPLLRFKFPGNPYKNLTVFCAEIKK